MKYPNFKVAIASRFRKQQKMHVKATEIYT